MAPLRIETSNLETSRPISSTFAVPIVSIALIVSLALVVQLCGCLGKGKKSKQEDEAAEGEGENEDEAEEGADGETTKKGVKGKKGKKGGKGKKKAAAKKQEEEEQQPTLASQTAPPEQAVDAESGKPKDENLVTQAPSVKSEKPDETEVPDQSVPPAKAKTTAKAKAVKTKKVPKAAAEDYKTLAEANSEVFQKTKVKASSKAGQEGAYLSLMPAAKGKGKFEAPLDTLALAKSNVFDEKKGKKGKGVKKATEAPPDTLALAQSNVFDEKPDGTTKPPPKRKGAKE